MRKGTKLGRTIIQGVKAKDVYGLTDVSSAPVFQYTTPYFIFNVINKLPGGRSLEILVKAGSKPKKKL